MVSVEYGVNVTNKFAFLSDDEPSDPSEALRRAEAAMKKEEKTASQKKADRKNAQKAKKEAMAAAAIAAKEAELRKQHMPQPKKDAQGANKENRGFGNRGRGGNRGNRPGNESNLPPRMQTGVDGNTDSMSDRFGEGQKGRGGTQRGNFRGRPRGNFRGSRGRGHQVDYVEHSDGDQRSNAAADSFGIFGDEAGEKDFSQQNAHNGYGGRIHRGGYRGGRGIGRGSAMGGAVGIGERGHRGNRGGNRGRQFDRSSGSDKTGIKASDKKSGYGKGNWGTEKDELSGETEPVNAAVDDGNAVKTDAYNEEKTLRPKTEAELKAEADAEQAANELTYEEYQAKLKATRGSADKPQFNIRQAGEGEDNSEFGKLIPIPKVTDPLLNESTDEEITIVRREPRNKRLNIQINFAVSEELQSTRGGGIGERGSRGGGRGAFRARGEFRGAQRGRSGGRDHHETRHGPGNDPFILSTDSFPELGAH